jgi:hypothetical protein
MKLQLRHGASMGHGTIIKCVTERLPNDLLDPFLGIQRDWMTEIKWEQSQIVESEDVVGVGVREQHAVNDPDPLAQQLRPEIGRRIDEQVSLGQSDQCGASQPLVSRMTAGTDGAATANHGDADRRAGSQQNELTADVFTGRQICHARHPIRKPKTMDRMCQQVGKFLAEPQGPIIDSE